MISNVKKKKIVAVKAKKIVPIITFIPEYLNKNDNYTVSVAQGFGL